MAKAPKQGIMSLPDEVQQMPEITYEEANTAAKEGVNDVDPKLLSMYDTAMSQVMPALMQLTDAQLDSLLQLVQYLLDHPDEYVQRVQELEGEGVVDKGTFPPEYDENFLSTFATSILEAQKTNQDEQPAPEMAPPATMARGGIAEAARMVASQGRSGDTMLAHITKDEAKLLRKRGGAGTVNPRTGLREYGLWSSIKGAVGSAISSVKSVVSSVASAVKTVLSSDIGRIAATIALATFIGPGAFGLTGAAGVAAQYGLASAGVTALGGGNLKDTVRAGVTGAVAGYGGATLGPAIGETVGVQNAAAQAAMGAGATATGMGALQGKSLKDSVMDGITSAAVAGSISALTPSSVKPGETVTEAGDVNVNRTTGNVTTGGDNVLAGVEGANIPTDQLTTDVARTTNGTPDWLKDIPIEPPATETPWQGAKDWVAQGQNMSINTEGQPLAGPQNSAPAPTLGQQAGDLWNKTTDYFSPSARADAGAQTAMESVQKQFPSATEAQIMNAPAGSPLAKAYSAALPGVMSNYGPMIGATLGIAGLAGGFKQQEPGPSALQQKLSGTPGLDLIGKNPSAYVPQNLPGVTYSPTGDIIGSQSWSPRPVGNVEVASSALPFSPVPSYTPPVNAITQNQTGAIRQPYNTSLPYGNLAGGIPQPQSYMDMMKQLYPQRAADGGYMTNTFPANPLTMDQGPRMAAGAMPLPMNTPGVPMNTPSGFAIGGIASLAVGGYPRRTGQISGPGTPTSDSIPAMLSDGEFVFTEKAVRGMGNGSRRTGAKKMYALMHQLEKNAARG